MPIQIHIRGPYSRKRKLGVCLGWVGDSAQPPTDSIKQQHFGTNSAGKTLDNSKPGNNPMRPVINWAALRENKAKYEAMKWAG